MTLAHKHIVKTVDFTQVSENGVYFRELNCCLYIWLIFGFGEKYLVYIHLYLIWL